jgi:uncharacterized Rmd1/YagE family protein
MSSNLADATHGHGHAIDDVQPAAFEARSRFLGARLTSSGAGLPAIGFAPARIDLQPGTAFLFRFGVVVTIDTQPAQDYALLERIAPFVRDAFPSAEFEDIRLQVDPGRPEGVSADGEVNLHEATHPRLEVVAHVLAKTTVLAYYEKRASEAIEQVERLAQQLREGDMPGGDRGLLRQIGETLLTETRTVGRVEITEKPEVTWDFPELDGLYSRLAAEFELNERDRALSRKLGLISSVAERCLDLLNTRRALRVEWYIVALIVFEIVLGLIDAVRA